MSDELQDALTSASSDPIEELKNDIGLTDTATSEPKAETKSEPTAEPEEKTEEAKSEDEAKSNEDADTEEPKSKPNKRNSLDKKLSRQAAANRRQLETINDLKAQLSEFQKTQEATPQTQELKRPDILDYDSHKDYEDAVSKYEDDLIERRFAEREEKANQERVQAEQLAKMQEMEGKFSENESRFKARHKNYDRNAESFLETLNYLPEEHLQGSSVLREYVAKSELGPNLIHHLGENPDLIDDITSQDVFGVIKGLYKLEMSLENSPTVSKKLPEPINKLQSSNEGGKAMNDMSWNELSKKLNL